MPLKTKTAPAPANAVPAAETQIIELPAFALLAAAACAHKPVAPGDGKERLTRVLLRKREGGVTVQSTNGVVAFRCTFEDLGPTPGTGCAHWEWDSADVIGINAGQLKGIKPNSGLAVVQPDKLILAIGPYAKSIEQRLIETKVNPDYPDCDQLWPSSFRYDTGKEISFDPAVLKTIIDICSKLKLNQLHFHTGTPLQPILAEARHDSCVLQFLAMPLSLRDSGQRAAAQLDRLIERFNHKAAADRDGIRAEVSRTGAVDFMGNDGLVFTARTPSQAKAVMHYIAGA